MRKILGFNYLLFLFPLLPLVLALSHDYSNSTVSSTCTENSAKYDDIPPPWFQKFLELYERNRLADKEEFQQYRLADKEEARQYRLADKEEARQYRLADKEEARQYRLADKEEFQQYRLEDRKYIYKLIKDRQHDLQSEVAAVLETSSVQLIDENNQGHVIFSTGHYILYEKYFLMLTVKHADNVKQTHWNCANLDVSIAFSCPVDSAINVTKYAKLRMGDDASTFGYILENDKTFGRFWRGNVAGILGTNRTHEESNSQFHADEYLFQGVAELAGMSGGLTANGFGYTGMVHGNNVYTNEKVSMACVIPFDLIKNICIIPMLQDKYAFKELKTIDDCSSVKVKNIPEF